MNLRQIVWFAVLCMGASAWGNEWRTSGYQTQKIIDVNGRYISDLKGKLWDMSNSTAKLIRSQVFDANASIDPKGCFTLDGASIVRNYRDLFGQNRIEMIHAVTGATLWQHTEAGDVIGVLGNGSEFAVQAGTLQVRSLATGAVVRQFAQSATRAFDNCAYVMSGDFNWYVYDLTAGHLIKSIPCNNWPKGAVYSNNNRYIVFSYGETTTSIEWIDVLNSTRVPMPNLGSPIAASDDGNWVLERSGNTLFLIETLSQSIVTLPAPINSSEAMFTPDGTALVVSGDNGLRKYRLSDMGLLSQSGIKGAFSSSVYDATSQKVYAAGGLLATFNDTTGDIVETFTIAGKQMAGVSIGDNRRSLATGYVDSPTTFKLVLKSILQGGTESTITVPINQSYAARFVVSNLSKKVLVQRSSTGLSLYDLSGLLMKSVNWPQTVTRIRTLPNDSRWYFNTNTGETIEVVGDNLVEQRREPGYFVGASPNSQTYLSITANKYVLKQVAGGQIVRELEDSGLARSNTDCGWTLDGSVVFAIARDETHTDHVVAWSTRTGKRLWTSPTREEDVIGVTISPDGRRMCTTTSKGEIWSRDCPIKSEKSFLIRLIGPNP